MKPLFPFLLFLSTIDLVAQSARPIDHGLKSFSISDKKLGSIDFYVDTTNISERAPLFVDVNGSGGLPLCIYVKGKDFDAMANTYSTDVLSKTKGKYHYIILDKPGTPFCDTITTDQSVDEYDIDKATAAYKFSEEYTKRLSLEWRVQATKKVILYLIKHGFWDHTKIVAYGYSEGAQVVATLAVEDKRVTHVVAIAGSGLDQFYDGIIGWRVKAAKGEITQEQAQDSINAGLMNVADVFKHPTATDKELGGHSYLRWASFCSVAPFEQLRKLTIPIYMLAATDDASSPIYGLDYVLLDFMRLGKTNLTYETCVGCDHYLTTMYNGERISRDHLQDILLWVDKN